MRSELLNYEITKLLNGNKFPQISYSVIQLFSYSSPKVDRSRRGFTLIELLIVIAIIGVLAALGGYVYAAALVRNRDSQRITDLQFIRNGLEQYYLDNRAYPTFQASANLPQATWQLEAGYKCQSNTKKFLAPKYLGAIPQDPSHKFDANDASCASTSFGQYLYYGLPKSDSKTDFWLMARMERVQNINYTASAGGALSGYSNLPVFCDATKFTAQCAENYFVTGAKNN